MSIVWKISETHPRSNILERQLISQRIYQIAGGYENTNDSNYLRHDPILKIACERVPRPGEELLASQPTISRLENQISKGELAAIRRLFVERFIQSYSQAPKEIILDIDGWDAQTYGHQQLSLFHGSDRTPNVLPSTD